MIQHPFRRIDERSLGIDNILAREKASFGG